MATLVQSGAAVLHGVFASGSGATPMTSGNYQMQAVVGGAGLPNNVKVLSSAHYRSQPGFLVDGPILLDNLLYLCTSR